MFKSLLSTSILLASAALMLTGCNSTKAKEALGVGRQSPDEFAVVERAPLSMPPSYKLKAPQPGTPRPQEISTMDQARALITGDDNIKTQGMSNAEAMLVQKAGGAQANPAIRSVLNQEYGVIPEGSKTERTVDKLNPFKGNATKGKEIDPTEEADALRTQGVNTPKPITPEKEAEK